ncbi:hypothetical protein K503DRAFT_301350 [Rhizopogon vinicolor AM-OR11-026]|uniref:Uncharacterized protein n=1 Tax=Rhizopogon vinicolor AM-OR11-026 TaxID=1314800 RepID=A0A1B7MUY3_9AGAM|nr:hypothetical protein K503DRAFT_301350 [Rhizopogon vinicolor AM-OR11-026]
MASCPATPCTTGAPGHSSLQLHSIPTGFPQNIHLTWNTLQTPSFRLTVSLPIYYQTESRRQNIHCPL